MSWHHIEARSQGVSYEIINAGGIQAESGGQNWKGRKKRSKKDEA
jgi:hypothetical protein